MHLGSSCKDCTVDDGAGISTALRERDFAGQHAGLPSPKPIGSKSVLYFTNIGTLGSPYLAASGRICAPAEMQRGSARAHDRAVPNRASFFHSARQIGQAVAYRSAPQALQEWEPQSYEKQLDAVEAALRSANQDAVADVRSTGRALFGAYCAAWPERAAAFLNHADSGMQQRLAAAVASYAPTGSWQSLVSRSCPFLVVSL
jgi:hypothetical protein